VDIENDENTPGTQDSEESVELTLFGVPVGSESKPLQVVFLVGVFAIFGSVLYSGY
jgi:hypothetical protein